MKKTIDILVQQLTEKDRQIESLLKTIQELSAKQPQPFVMPIQPTLTQLQQWQLQQSMWPTHNPSQTIQTGGYVDFQSGANR